MSQSIKTLEPTPSSQLDEILEVRGLTVQFLTTRGPAVVVDGVDFNLQRGKTLSVVGESGSGKTVTSLAVLRLISGPKGKISGGSIKFDGKDLLQLPKKEMNAIRGRDISMIFQEPRRSLDPAFTVGEQIAEVARRHLDLNRSDARTRAVDMLAKVGILSPAKRYKDYPHMFSGGMCQRVMLAMALVASPKILIADEPTTALDVTVQALVLDLLRELQEELGLAILFITHDLGVVAEISDRVAVMYAGQIVETASADDIFNNPKHPYTAGLLASLPQNNTRDGRLGSIPGVVPPPHDWPAACRFNSRCQYAMEICRDGAPPLEPVGIDHLARCVRVDELELKGIR